MQKTEHELPTLNRARDVPKRGVEPSISQSRMVSAQARSASAKFGLRSGSLGLSEHHSVLDDRRSEPSQCADRALARESRPLWKIYHAEGRTVVQPSGTLKHVLFGAARDWQDAQDGLDGIHLHCRR